MTSAVVGQALALKLLLLPVLSKLGLDLISNLALKATLFVLILLSPLPRMRPERFNTQDNQTKSILAFGMVMVNRQWDTTHGGSRPHDLDKGYAN